MNGERYSRICKNKKVVIVILMLTKIDFKTMYIILLKQKRDVSWQLNDKFVRKTRQCVSA